MTTWDDVMTNNDKLSKQVKKDPDLCMTNPLMAKYIISLVPFEKGDIVIEPCKGKGAFYDNFPNFVKKEYCEIDEDLDYLQYQGEVDWTISNPPFAPRKLFWDFHLKAMKTTRKGIYWLINMSSFNVFTPKRLKEMTDYGWYIKNLKIVQDKRWFGRYVVVCITKEPNDFITCDNFSC